MALLYVLKKYIVPILSNYVILNVDISLFLSYVIMGFGHSLRYVV